MSPSKKPAEILLVEDNPGDIELIREALKRGGHNAHLHVTTNGQQALDYLLGAKGHDKATRPNIILLDLGLPGKSGQELLAQIKENPNLADIPVIVLTGSEADKDVAATSALHANCYVAKPTGFTESMQALGTVLHFWLNIVRLPS